MSMASSSSSPPPWELGLKTDAAEQERLNALQLQFNTDGRIPSCGEDGHWKGINFATRNTPILLSPQTTAKALQATLALMDEGADDDDDDAPDVDPSFFLPAEAEPCSMHEVLARATRAQDLQDGAALLVLPMHHVRLRRRFVPIRPRPGDGPLLRASLENPPHHDHPRNANHELNEYER